MRCMSLPPMPPSSSFKPQTPTPTLTLTLTPTPTLTPTVTPTPTPTRTLTLPLTLPPTLAQHVFAADAAELIIGDPWPLLAGEHVHVHFDARARCAAARLSRGESSSSLQAGSLGGTEEEAALCPSFAVLSVRADAPPAHALLRAVARLLVEAPPEAAEQTELLANQSLPLHGTVAAGLAAADLNLAAAASLAAAAARSSTSAGVGGTDGVGGIGGGNGAGRAAVATDADAAVRVVVERNASAALSIGELLATQVGQGEG